MATYFIKLTRYLKKWRTFLLDNDCLSIRERLKIITALDKKTKDAVIRECIMRRLQTPKDGKEFFFLAGHRIYFQPDHEVRDKEYYMKGIVSVLIETFLLPDYFNSNVYLKKGDIVFDLGSNIGTTALLFSKIIGESGRLFAFEPVTYKVLSLNVERNNISNIEIIPKGVSDKPGTTEIEISDYGLDSSAAKRDHTKNYYRHKKIIDLTSLDAFAEEKKLNKIDFIKMDIEGMEELAIKGAIQIIKKYHPKWSISSYHIDCNNEPQHKKLINLLKDACYKVEEIEENHIYAW